MSGAVQDSRELAWRESGQGAGEIAAHQKVELGVVRGREGMVRGCGAGWVVEMLLRGAGAEGMGKSGRWRARHGGWNNGLWMP